jgi:integrase
MPSVRRRGTGWQATYRGPDHHERTRTFPRKIDADRWVTDQLAALNRGEWVDPRNGRTTFGAFAEAWRKSQIHSPGTAELIEGHFRRHVLPTFGHRPLASVRPSEIQALVKRLSEHLSPGTVEFVFRYVSGVFKAAAVDRLISGNPCSGARLPKKQPVQVEPLPTAEVLAIISAMPERLRGAAVLGAGAGLRQGEACGVTLDRVDFLRRQVVVDRQILTPVGAPPRFGPPKTQASNRTVPLCGYVLGELARHLEHFEPGDQGLLFTTQAGAPVRRSYYDKVVARAVARAGARPGTRHHDLRHYYASLLIQAGESVKVVQARLGHASARETLDTYAHLWPDTEDSSRKAVDDILGRSAADFSRTSEGGDEQQPSSEGTK